ncbi:A/G-specific adenine glycosylase [Candidatus Dependentiae bacterium]
MQSFNKQPLSNFKETIWNYYRVHGRDFAWRNVNDPYKVFISEVMLQQTQTKRVIAKYEQFLIEFSSFEMLAAASLRDVLTVWQGLGYNRRGKFLHEAAQIVIRNHNGILPNNPDLLIALPGIGPATAASICAFVFNKPTVFIETNIRAVFLHFFFKGKSGVHDKQLMPLIKETVDTENPREWYYALMDYGVILKQTIANPSRASKHHAVQSKFEGSNRQIRGKIITLLTDHPTLTQQELLHRSQSQPERFLPILQQLVNENIIKQNGDILSIP